MIIPIAAVLVGFLIWCFICDSGKDGIIGGSIGGGDREHPLYSLFFILCRMVAKNIKLVLKLAIGLVLALGAVGGIMSYNAKPRTGPFNGSDSPEETKGFINTVTAPVQWVIDGFMGILGVLAILFVSGVTLISDSIKIHPNMWLTIAIVVYVLWLVVTTNQVVEEEIGPGDLSGGGEYRERNKECFRNAFHFEAETDERVEELYQQSVVESAKPKFENRMVWTAIIVLLVLSIPYSIYAVGFRLTQ